MQSYRLARTKRHIIKTNSRPFCDSYPRISDRDRHTFFPRRSHATPSSRSSKESEDDAAIRRAKTSQVETRAESQRADRAPHVWQLHRPGRLRSREDQWNECVEA